MKANSKTKGNPKTKGNTKTKNNSVWTDEMVNYSEENNVVSVVGYVKKVIYDGDKVSKYCVELARKTEKGNIARSWITVVSFDYELEVDLFYTFGLEITTNSYNNNFTTEFVLLEALPIDEVPFN
ncbi:MAG: hypothetical protein MJ237_08585 [bacterium]|nr:hypothetical protein [bacterium]